MNKTVITLILLSILTSASAGGYVSNKSYCLSVDDDNTVGDMAYLVNGCNEDLEVTYCFAFGASKCNRTPGATSIKAYGKKTISMIKKDEEPYQFTAFACGEDVDFDDCYQAKRDFFKYKK